MKKYTPVLLLFIASCAGTQSKNKASVSLIKGRGKGDLLFKIEVDSTFGKRKILTYDGPGEEIYSMEIFFGDEKIQECSEGKLVEKEKSSSYFPGPIATLPGGAIMWGAGGRSGGLDISGVKHIYENDIFCVLRKEIDTLTVKIFDPDGLMAKYRVITSTD